MTAAAGLAPRLASYLTSYPGQVDDRLHALTAAFPEPLAGTVRTLVNRPGKRLRSAFVAACGVHGTADPDRLARLGAVVELLHVASLLHDDVVDRAEVRRGAPAAHVVVGREAAMLAGVACFSLAGTEAADLGPGVSRAVGTAAATLAYGELLDVERAFDTGTSIEDYLELVRTKTGALFRLACALGAAEARTPPETARALARFGLEFGVAFQVLDDCLDLTEGATGKPAGTDHVLGLFGAPTLFALRRDHGGGLARLLLSPSFSPSDLPTVREHVVRTGGLAAATQLARQRFDDAIAGLPGDGRYAHLETLCRTLWNEAAAP